MKKILLIVGLLYLFGCTTISEVITIGPDLYIISATSLGYEKSIEKVYEKAGQTCDQENKQLLRTKMDNEVSAPSDIVMYTVILEFRCLDSDHPAFIRADEKRESDQIIEVRRKP